MEKSNGKIIAVVALVVAVVALSIGFAAFADQLTIDGTATVKKGANLFAENFNYSQDQADAPQCVYTDTETEAANTSAGTASMNAWTGISVTLTTEHPSVTCTAKVANNSAYKAQLTSISASGALSCSTGTGTDAATNVNTVCTGVTETVKIGSTDTLSIDSTSSGDGLTNRSVSQQVAKDAKETVTVIVAYDTTKGVPDGDVSVTLPTITHAYTTVAD